MLTVSSEKQFIHGDAFSKGFVQIPKVVTSSPLLPITAKAIYIYLCSHAYEKGSTVFPSVTRIATYCNISTRSAIRYLEFLCNSGLIQKTKEGRGKANTYHIADVDKVEFIRVSDKMCRVLRYLEKQKKYSQEQLLDALSKLDKSLTKLHVNVWDIPDNEEIEKWMEDSLINLMGGMDIMKVPARKSQVVIPTAHRGVERAGEKTEENWNIKDFISYFYVKYERATGNPHTRTERKHTGQLSRVLKTLDGDKYALRKAIDDYFTMGYGILTLEWFTTGGRMDEIKRFQTEGTKPKQFKQKQKQESKPQIRRGLTAEELF